MDLTTILIALALVAIIEGIGPLVFPIRWKHYLLSVCAQPANALRRIGGALVVGGLVSLYYLTR